MNRFSTQQNGMTNSFFFLFGVYRVLEKSSSILDRNVLLSVLQTIKGTAVIKPERKAAWLETVKKKKKAKKKKEQSNSTM